LTSIVQSSVGILSESKASFYEKLHPKVSVVIPAYNEESGVGRMIEGFRRELESIEVPYEVIVVDNNSTDRTLEMALQCGARVVREERQGYGYACIRALMEAGGDIIILTEADNTFNPRDVRKLLVYLDEEDVDLVLGTRTTLELVEMGAKMDWFLHWGNLFIAKLIQIQFWGKVRLTDVGCTFRGIKRQALLKVIDKFREGGPCFSPEMIIWSLKAGLRTIEIPVRYMKRLGYSKITANKKKSLIVGFKMLKLILSQRFWEE
jgi:glycosyltransferase involved in cell wall biosynthesis